MAVTGHETLTNVERYTSSALRKSMADAAFDSQLSQSNREQTMVNLTQGLANEATNKLKKED